jgi:hypothetical protein
VAPLLSVLRTLGESSVFASEWAYPYGKVDDITPEGGEVARVRKAAEKRSRR